MANAAPTSICWVGDGVADSLLSSFKSATKDEWPDVVHSLRRCDSFATLGEVAQAGVDADVVIISASCGVSQGELVCSGDPAQLEPALELAVEQMGTSARVIVVVPSTVDGPRDRVVQPYTPVTAELHCRIVAAVRVAARTGVSIVDLDRLVAEQGATTAVRGLLDYDAELLESAAHEVARVLRDDQPEAPAAPASEINLLYNPDKPKPRTVDTGARPEENTIVHEFVRRTLPANSAPRRLWRQFKPAEKKKLNGAVVRRRDTSVYVDVDAPSEVSGIYLHGACDVERVLDVGELLAPRLTHSLAIKYDSHVSMGRPDLLLSLLDGNLPEDDAEVRERLNLNEKYFEPSFFNPTFTLDKVHEGPVRKDVYFTTMAPPIARSLYRHNTEGYLVDPGAWWLRMSQPGATRDPETLKWLRKSFTSIGRPTVDEWERDFRRLHHEIVARTGAKVVVFNLLTVEPHDQTHCYRGRNAPETVRRRLFALRLYELAKEIDIEVVDVDRRLKESSITEAVDFAHMPREYFHGIIRESAELLIERGLVRVNGH